MTVPELEPILFPISICGLSGYVSIGWDISWPECPESLKGLKWRKMCPPQCLGAQVGRVGISVSQPVNRIARATQDTPQGFTGLVEGWDC